MSFETISVIGLGYIGLPTAAMFASRKKKVIGVDVNQMAVDTINRGEIHIVEPELDIIVHSVVKEGYLRAVTTPEPADAFLIAVPTPFQSNGSEIPEPDLGHIKEAAKAIAPVLKKGDLVVLESTSPVGATEQLAEWLASCRPDLSFPQQVGEFADISVAHCPERVLPGNVVRELVKNDRVIGGISDRCSESAIQLYKIFVEGECITTNARTAEMAKLTENACRDVQIAFANELSIICDELNINVWELIDLANKHPRINILQPGPGVGGHCIAVDPWFIVNKSPKNSHIIHTARKVNNYKTLWVVEKIRRNIEELLRNNSTTNEANLTIGLYGLAFKPNIDDLRESAAVKVAEKLREISQIRILVVEPNIESPSDDIIKGTEFVSTDFAVKNSDLNVLLVDHKEFKNVKFPRTKKLISFCNSR